MGKVKEMSKNSERIRVLDKKGLSDLLGCEEKAHIEDMITIENIARARLRDAIVYNYDSVEADKTENIDLRIDNVIEARFFNQDSELRIFREEGTLSGIIFKELEGEEYLNETLILYPREKQRNCPEKLEARKYLDYDGDKQAYVSYVKPSRLIFKEEN